MRVVRSMITLRLFATTVLLAAASFRAQAGHSSAVIPMELGDIHTF